MNRWLVAGSLLLVSSTALAADKGAGFYLGVSGGTSKYDIEKQTLDAISTFAFTDNGVTPRNQTSSLDDSDTAFTLVAGFRFNPYLSVETGYADLGTAKYSSSSTVTLPFIGTFPAKIGIDVNAKGPFVAGSVGAPLGPNFDVHGHLGAFFAKTEFDISVALGSSSERDSVSSRSTGLYAGVGLGYHFSESFVASVDYARYKDVGDEDETGSGDITALRIGVQYIIPL